MIYLVTTLRRLDLFTGPRCVGWFETQKEAIKIVEGNYGDIYEEGHFPYAVIEGVEKGLYMYDDNPLWFKWENEKYIKIENPLKNVSGFGMG